MYAPEGYFRWTDLLEASQYWAEIIIRAHALEDTKGKDSHLVGLYPFQYPDGHRGRLSQNIIRAWCIANFMDIHPPQLSNSIGAVVQSQRIICIHSDRLDECRITGRPDEQAEFRLYFSQHEKGLMPTDAPLNRFPCIEYQTGLVVEKNSTAREIERECCEYEIGSKHQLCFVQNYLGWSLCWNERQLPEGIPTLFHSIGLPEIADMYERGLAEKGIAKRALKVSEGNLDYVAECVLSAFPDGKGAATWDEVVQRIGFSRRHIMRAVKTTPSLADWNAQVGKPKDS